VSDNTDLDEMIDRVASQFGTVWPLHSFVTANPLSGMEHLPFREAVRRGEQLYGGCGYPSARTFRRAWERGAIDPDVLEYHLAASSHPNDPERSLEKLDEEPRALYDGKEWTDSDRAINRIVSKYLSAFLDQGRAHWPMPGRTRGFYHAVRRLAPHDGEIPDSHERAQWPQTAQAALHSALDDLSASAQRAALERQMAALPGWTGFIKYRVERDEDWQSEAPITLSDYLAVRLQLVEQSDAPIEPPEARTARPPQHALHTGDDRTVPLHHLWLEAWEETYRRTLVDALQRDDGGSSTETPSRPDAQLVFCIDTRSEIIRRHLEAQGNYHTHGYAGFFGIPMTYRAYTDDVDVDACPPIVDAEHRIEDHPDSQTGDMPAAYERSRHQKRAAGETLGALQSNPATAFSFVEQAGIGYGLALLARTLLPGKVYDWLQPTEETSPTTDEVCSPTINPDDDRIESEELGLTVDQQVDYASAAFDLMGFKQFGRLVVFVGHTAHTTNNPFDSSLDCGACAANPGGPSARVLAAICRNPDVRRALESRGHDIPEDTIFLAGEHNTTTDDITLYDRHVPESHHSDLKALRADLQSARRAANEERRGDLGDESDDPKREMERRCADWAQTRPEWGLAGNASFIIGPRRWTSDLDLDGRAFLHSYDWTTDPDGDALEAIMTGPMVVTQWINNQYYFATVDNAVYGSGTKVTQNPTGNIGVFQGNGGDLMCGLPLQSVKADDDTPYHQPIRLATVIEAPLERVQEILTHHDQLVTLLDHGWLSLTVVDPRGEGTSHTYDGELQWTLPNTETTDKQAAPTHA
jgi:uncharacterized protein YbcC (UPF0753/DUF2309 family)